MSDLLSKAEEAALRDLRGQIANGYRTVPAADVKTIIHALDRLSARVRELGGKS